MDDDKCWTLKAFSSLSFFFIILDVHGLQNKIITIVFVLLLGLIKKKKDNTNYFSARWYIFGIS